MLGWLAVAAAPVVIHLLSRRRYRVSDWAAMQFLVAAVRESRRRLRIENVLLLVVRTLIIVLVVSAVADPYVESSGLLFAAGGGRTHRVLVLDGSYSMGYETDGRTRFDRAKELAARIVEASPQGDGFSLVLMSSPPRAPVDSAALSPADFLRELEAARPTEGSFDLAATLECVDSVLRKTRRERPRFERHEVYFLTDLGRVGWTSRAGRATDVEAVRLAKQLANRARLVVIDLGRPGADNLAVTRLESVGACVTTACPVEIAAVPHNFGRRDCNGQNVELMIDGRRAARRTVDLSAGRSSVVRFTHRFDAPGDHVAEVRLKGDRLPVDNWRRLVLPVRRSIGALCVDGRPGGPRGGACAYLAVALAPGDDLQAASWVRPRIVPESTLVETDLSPYDCVFLCDVAQVTPSEARMLGRYVRAGGGLVVFLGDRVDAARYNRELFDGESLLPARLQGVVEGAGGALDPRDYAHPIVEPFRGREKAGLLNTPIEKYYKLTLPRRTNARVALATQSGEPLIVTQSVGRGRVALVATSADTSWTAGPLWPSYVPIVQEILAYAIAGRIAERNVMVGEAIFGTVSGAGGDGGRVRLPDGREQTLSIRSAAEGREWSFDGTEQSGVYAVRFDGSEAESLFAVNVDTIESDLDKLTEAQLREEIWPGVTFDYRTTWEEATTATIGPRAGLARGLLVGVLVLLLAETLLGRRFGHYDTQK